MAINKKTDKSYSDKLKDPRWQKKRLEIMQRDQFKCQDCWSEDKPLTIHHKYYIYQKEPWEYDNNMLITLCEDCHLWWEDRKYIINDFTKVLLVNGWTPLQLEKLLDIILLFTPSEITLECLKEVGDLHKESMDNFVKAIGQSSQQKTA